MQPSSSFIVVMMFVTLLSIGLGNLIMSISGSVSGRRPALPIIALTWEVILIFVHFNLVWRSLDALKIEDFSLFGFLLIQSGPVLLIFANQVIGAGPNDSESGLEAYLASAPRFFSLLALVQLWFVFIDLLFGDWGLASYVNLVFAGVCAALVVSKRVVLHYLGATLGALLLVLTIVVRELLTLSQA